MKTLKICAVILLCALLVSCTGQKENKEEREKNFIYYNSDLEYLETLKEQMEANRASYKGKTIELTLDGPDTYTLTNAEGQTLTFDVNCAYGDLLWLSTRIYSLSTSNKFPYSDSFSLTIPEDSPQKYYGIEAICGSITLYASGSGATEISIDDLKRCELKGSETIDAIARRRIRDQVTWGSRMLTLSGSGSKHITVEFTETGAIVKGMEGDCEITYMTSSERKTTYDCNGKAFEVDVVSQPGEILVTPIEG